MEGAVLGPYRVLGDLGSGGMGRVYRAEVVTRTPGLETGCQVALKVIHAHLLDTPGFFQRFLREADIGRSVEHVNVVRTYLADALLHEGVQQNFLVMEYVEGQTLRDLLVELERVPEELCRHIGREVAKGLQAIHEAGVVHRDLKPENVLITNDHQVKIMDLGVARLQNEAIRLSQTGVFVGSLEYAAPEQFQSGGEDADGRADLHALGVMLYEFATGQHPYRDDDARKILRNILDVSPRKAGEVNPQLSPFFEEAVQTLLAKDRIERFATASDLVEVLEAGEDSAWWKAKAKALRLETKRPLRRIRIPRETALYGRDDDLAKLQALYEKAKAGDGQVLLIEGEAGIGKTRLVDEFVGRLREKGEDVNFLFGSYPPGGAATAAGAFSTAYREQFGAEGLEETLSGYLTATPLLVPAFAALLKGDATPTGAEALTQDSLQTVFVHATKGLAEERPTIVLIDDLHFAPEEGRSLFSSLAAAAPESPVLVMGSMRPGLPESWVANVERLDHARRTLLSRLGPKDLARLLEEAFQSERLAEELAYRIGVKSDGNPFFAFEIIRGLREGQFIAQEADGTWVTTKVIDDIQVPSSVLDLVEARVADLSEEERDLLDVASCCGFDFDPTLVADALELGQIPALKRLARIEKKHHLVRAAGANYVFDHHQVQEALYGGLHEKLKQAYHHAIAAALERTADVAEKDPAELDGALCVALCDHHLRGHQPKRVLPYLEPALTHLADGYMNDQLILLADRALSTAGLLESEARIRVLMFRNHCLDLLMRHDEQEAGLDEALALAEAADEHYVARVERARGVLYRSLNRYAQALESSERSRNLSREIGDLDGEAAATINLASDLSALGRLEEALGAYEAGARLAVECGNRRWEANASTNTGYLLKTMGRPREGLEWNRRALTIFREIEDPSGLAIVHGSLGRILLELGQYEEAETHLRAQLVLAGETGRLSSKLQALQLLTALLRMTGRYEEAWEFAERYSTFAREVGDRHHYAAAALERGSLEFVRGRPRAARREYERAIAGMQELASPLNEAGARANLASVLSKMGLFTEARAQGEGALTTLRDKGDRHNEAIALENLAPVYLGLGETGRARDAIEQAQLIGAELAGGFEDGDTRLQAARVADQEGDSARALELAEEATTIHRGNSYCSGLAEALLLLGDLRCRAGQPAAAASALQEAVSLGEAAGNRQQVARGLAQLACLPDGDVDAALTAIRDLDPETTTPELPWLLWRATSDSSHLAEAKGLLDGQLAKNATRYHDAMRKNVRVNREILAAWAELSQRG